ncbi:CAAX prenyl protease-related protein [Methylophilus sp.]|uniref:CAAX prenyl protease-related protein n=1 Tax=Methylophilus sp. TaxID=29541 RepID=UPI004036C802
MSFQLQSLFTLHERARIYPFIGFILLLACEPLLASGLSWLGLGSQPTYLLRTLAAVALLLYFWRDYTELSLAPSFYHGVIAILSGLLVFAIWILPYPAWMGGYVAADSKALPLYDAMDVFWLVCRWSGSALVVPVIEELFWRAYLMRRLEHAEFMAVSPAAVGTYAVLVSSVLFAIEHQLWFAGLLAGLIYAGLYRRYQLLWVAVLAHMVTNGVLGAWVVLGGHWQYW